MARPRKAGPTTKDAQTYRASRIRPAGPAEIGAQAHFKKTKPPTATALIPRSHRRWNGTAESARGTRAKPFSTNSRVRIADCRFGQNNRRPPNAPPPSAALQSEIRSLQSEIQKISGPFLNWSGKAERLSFDVPTLPLFVHERLSTSAILDTLKGHRRDKQDDFLGALYGFSRALPLRPGPARLRIPRQLGQPPHARRLPRGDEFAARYESLGGQVQMIYVDPPYGVKFGSNFQPFVRRKPDGSSARDVVHNDDSDMTVNGNGASLRDTGNSAFTPTSPICATVCCSPATFLAPSGSIFVQISDENLHHVREVMDEVFGAENFVSVIHF